MKLLYKPLLFIIASSFLSGFYLHAAENNNSGSPEFDKKLNSEIISSNDFLALLQPFNQRNISAFVQRIEQNWHPGYIPMIIEVMYFSRSEEVVKPLLNTLKKMTGQTFTEITDWYHWLWNQPEVLTPDYAQFKSKLYRQIDSSFDTYFRDRQHLARIRLDEIRWGGVVQDGIPPLRSPKMIEANYANYLDDDNVIFGIEINGDARAYPKRVLAWHEMFTDTVGGVDIAGVYCTLCGTVIPYKTQHNGTKYDLGTSGFLYRSNKLMYDAKTQSLWNTIRGEPVLGPLVDQNIALEFLSVVTTTWGEWRHRHPKTTVLSLDTGHRRDYGEGVAYQSYFATDKLMFNTPFDDQRLQNKQEILALRFTASPRQQLAIDTTFLKNNPVYTDKVGLQKILVLTDKTGANRVYDPQDAVFISYDGDNAVTDDKGKVWQLSEALLTAADGRTLHKLPYHRAFWFGWHATFPQTRLVK